MQVLIPSQSNFKSNFSILHQVPEGHVGVYWRGGALLKTITDPGLSLSFQPYFFFFMVMQIVCPAAFIHIKISGFHLKLPLLTQFVPVQVTLQTDQVN